jgi:glycosyltransferase involved in cell wall biosynthesis
MADPAGRGTLRVHVDVTDTVRTRWRAGIQRVVLQLLVHLRTVGAEEGLEVVPVVWLDSARSHRRLTAAEAASLQPAGSDPGGPHGGPPAAPAEGAGGRAPKPGAWLARLAALRTAPALRPVRRVLRPLKRAARALVRATGGERHLAAARRRLRLLTVDRPLRHLVVRLGPGDVLFEVDSVWNVVEVDRDELYGELRGRGVHVAVLVYDLLPVEHPEWFEASLVEVFDRALRAQARHAEAVLAISAHTAAAFVRWRGRPGPTPVVIPLGADVPAAAPARDGGHGPGGPRPGGSADGLADAPYALVVGTVEPRKNHAVLLDAMELIWAGGSTARLVVVGRPGWNNDAVIERLRTHPELGARLRWFDAADDALLDVLYRDAAVVAVPSVTEGFGLPVIEALAHGVPVVASTGGALPEAGGDLVVHVDAGDVAGWARELDPLLHDDARRAELVVAIAGYRPPTWQHCAREVARTLRAGFCEANS